MNKTLFIVILIIILSSCSGSKNETKVVIAKWNFSQTKGMGCEDDKSNSPTSCVFHYKGELYLRTESYKLDLNGKIDSVYSYHMPLGVNGYDLEQYGRLMTSDTLEFNEMKTFQIEWNNDTKKITENNEIVNHTLIEDNNVVVINGDELIIYELSEKKSQ